MPGPSLHTSELLLEGHEQRRDGIRGSLGCCSSSPETRYLKEWESISHLIGHPRNMAGPDKEVMFHRYKDKKPQEVHNTWALERPEFKMTTTDLLSHQNWVRFPEKWGNQKVHTTTMGKSSCHSMITPQSLLSCIWGSHLPWNHFPLKYPQKPIAPEALVYRLMSGNRVTVESRKTERPFHLARKAFHMSMSLKNSLFRRMWWKWLGTSLIRSIICYRKVLPGMTALQVNCRVLISDWNSIKRTERQPLKEFKSAWVGRSLSSGSRASIWVLSNSMPMNSKI